MSARLANLLGAVALGLSDGILAAAGRHVAQGGCTATALSVVGHAPGSSIDLLARALGLSHPGTVRLVDRLAAAGLVERRPAAGDGRARALHLTAAGRRRRAQLLADRRRLLEGMLRRLSPTEQSALTRMLEKMLPDLVGEESIAYRVCRLCEEAVCRDCPIGTAFAGTNGTNAETPEAK